MQSVQLSAAETKARSLWIKWNRISRDILDEVNDNIKKTPEYRKSMRLGEWA